MNRRVAVTGVGVVCALGHNSRDFWQALCESRSGIQPLQAVAPGLLRFENGAEVRDWDPLHYFDEKETGLLDRFAQFGVVAAREAVTDAGVVWSAELREETAIVTGSCAGGQVRRNDNAIEPPSRPGPRMAMVRSSSHDDVTITLSSPRSSR